MGLCDVLGNVMTTLAEENSLLSWTVYYEKNGQISLKVRYQSSQKSVNRDQEDVHYKKKSTRQLQRDRERSRAWHKQKQAVNAESEGSKPPGVSSPMPVALQTRSKTRAASLCCTPENIRASSTPDGHRVSDMIPDALPFCPVNSTACDTSLLCVHDIVDSPDRDKGEDTDPSSSGTVDDPIDEISSLCDNVSELDCSDSDSNTKSDNSLHETDSNAENIPKRDNTACKAKTIFCWMCWYYDQGTGRCKEHG